MGVQMTSAVAMNVAGQLHNIPIVLSGVFFFNEKISPLAALGFSFCIVGAILYTSERRRSSDSRMVETEAYTLVEQEDESELEDFVQAKGVFNTGFCVANSPMLTSEAAALQNDVGRDGLVEPQRVIVH